MESFIIEKALDTYQLRKEQKNCTGGCFSAVWTVFLHINTLLYSCKVFWNGFSPFGKKNACTTCDRYLGDIWNEFMVSIALGHNIGREDEIYDCASQCTKTKHC